MKAGMEYLAASLFLLLRLLTLISALARNLDPPRYDTAYACEGKILKIECREGELIQLIRANYGRFSITICNDHGNTEWSVNCMSPKSFRVLHSKCTQQQNCSIPANTNLFGDPCAGTLKYLEAHYRCIPAATTTTTTRPSPPWLMASQPNVWSTAKLPTLRPPSHPSFGRASPAPPMPEVVASSERTTPTTATAAAAAAAVAVAAVSKASSGPREPSPTKSPSSHPIEPRVDDASEVTASPSVVSSSSATSSSSSASPTSPGNATTKPEEVPGLFPDYSEYNPLPTASRVPEGDSSHFCRPITSRNLEWNWTRVGEVNVQPCPGGAAGSAKWHCIRSAKSNSAKWSNDSPDLSQCRSVWLTSLDSRIEENDSVINIANDLSQVTSSKILYGGDMMTTTAIVKKITERISRNIQTFPDSQQREAIVAELLQSVVKTTSNLLDSPQDSGWSDLSHGQQMRVATSLLVGLEENAFLLADTVIREKTVVQSVKNILLSVRVMDVANVQETERFPGPRALQQRPNCTDWLEVPRNAMLDNSEGGFVRLIFVAFERLDDLLRPSRRSAAGEGEGTETGWNKTRIVNSKIISGSLGKGRHIQFAEFVRLGMKHLRTENVSNPACVFWDYTTSSWSEEGCEIELTNKTHTICRCNHLTNFAVLMDVHATHLPPAHQMALQIITYIGCIVSIVCLILAVVTFQIFRSLRSDRTTIHKNLCICLLLAEMLFLLGINQTDKPILCGVVAGLLHFVFLCAFAWMFLEGFQLYIMLIEVFEVEKSRIRWYYTFAYGAPLIVVCISCVVDPLSYGTDRYCWLRADNFFIFSFVGPVIAVILANLVFLSMAIYMMCRHSSASVSLKSKEHSRLASASGKEENVVQRKLQIHLTWLRGAIVLVFLLGLTWTFGLLYLNEESVAMAYVFTVLNSLQGLFIFLFHCLHNEKVRKEYRKWNSWLPKCFKCKKYQSSSGTVGKERRSSVYGASHGAGGTGTGSNSHTHSSSAGDGLTAGSLPNGNSSVGTEILGASHRYHHRHQSPVHHQEKSMAFVDLQKMYFKSHNNDLGRSHRGDEIRSNYGSGHQHHQHQGMMTLSSLPPSSFNGSDTSYGDKMNTLRSLHGGDVDLRRQHYRHGPDRVLVCELERHSHGSRAATLQLPRRRREQAYYGDEVLRKGDGDDPVYEEIRQAASDASDEELRRCVASRQSLRSCGDHSPLIPSSHVAADPSKVHGSHVHVVSDPHGFLYSPSRSHHVLPADR